MATTQVIYDSKRIIPALRISYSRTFNELPNGEIIGSTYNIVFSSTIVAHKGSPDSQGDFWVFNDYPPDEIITSDAKLSSILKKQEALRELFSSSNIGKKFEIIPENQDNPIWFYPRTIEISFAEGPWFQTCDYTISMTADTIYPSQDTFPENIEEASETWSIEPNEQPLGLSTFVPPQVASLASTPFTYRVTHSISATGKKVYSEGGSGNIPFLDARQWVASRTGIDNTVILSGFNNLSGLGAYNHILTETIDETAGSYAVNESWLFSSGNIIEDYTISQQGALDGTIQVGINGSIQGLELRNLQGVTQHKWDNASGYFASIQNEFLNRAQSFTNINLNPVPASYNIGRNPLQGNISYSYEYDNRPTSLISGAQSERIAVTYLNQNQKVAIVPVIGRAAGPVIQDLGTSEVRSKQLSIDFTLGPQISGGVYSTSDFDFPYNLISGLVEDLDPANLGAYKSKKNQPQETWEPLTGIASYSIEWIYEL